MWAVIYIAPNKMLAEAIKRALEAEGLMVQLRSVSLSEDNDRCQIEILVPKSEATEAHEILSTVLR